MEDLDRNVVEANLLAQMEQLIAEAKGQAGNLLDEWARMIFRAFKKNGNALKVSIAIDLDGNSGGAKVTTKMSFTSEKITDEREGEITFNQERIPGV